MAGLYIHIPFCKQACHYCDFHFSTNQGTRTILAQAIASELKLQSDYLRGELIETIYFGGGTPSLLSDKELEIIFSAIYTNFQLATAPEITLEANPDDLTRQKLVELKSMGVNRLSIGIQSFDDTVLTFFNRAHSATEALQCVALSREVGFDNLSLDLIYSIPGQDLTGWKKNIEQAISLQPEHISAYSLTVEDKTVFGHRQKKGTLKPLEERESIENFEVLIDSLVLAGFEQYEISNFCKPGYYSKHNSSYWKQKKYLGVGPSAHSYNFESRQSNINNNSQYTKSINSGTVPCEIEILNKENKINEYIFTTLRTQWGCDIEYLKKELGYDLLQSKVLKMLLEKQFINLENKVLTLTRSGKFLADQIALDLFVLS